jgi:hypothetical protein
LDDARLIYRFTDLQIWLAHQRIIPEHIGTNFLQIKFANKKYCSIFATVLRAP